MRKLVFLVILNFFSLVCFSFSPVKPVATVPFEMVGSYVVVQVRINNSNKLSLVLDTGVRSTIITELLPGDSIDLDYTNVRDLQGLGQGVKLNAYLSSSNTLQLSRKFKLTNKTVYVLQEDVFNLTRQTGTKING